MARFFRKLIPGSKTTRTSRGGNERTYLLSQDYTLSSSGSSPIEAICYLFEEEPIIEPSSESGSSKISPSYSAAVTAIADPGTRMRFKPIFDEHQNYQTVMDSRCFPVLKRSVSCSAVTQSKATIEPTPRATSCVEDRKSLMVTQELEVRSQYLGSEEPSDLEFISRQNSNEDPPLVPYRTLKQRYIYYSIYVVNSIFIVPFLLLFFGFGCFNCYMGLKYLGQCHFMEKLPFLIVLMGASGLIGISSRVIFILTEKRWFPEFENCRCVTLISILTFTICYAIESLSYIFNQSSPSTEKGPGYCHPYFYNYVYWYNWAVLPIVIILAVLHGPNSCGVQ